MNTKKKLEPMVLQQWLLLLLQSLIRNHPRTAKFGLVLVYSIARMGNRTATTETTSTREPTLRSFFLDLKVNFGLANSPGATIVTITIVSRFFNFFFADWTLNKRANEACKLRPSCNRQKMILCPFFHLND